MDSRSEGFHERLDSIFDCLLEGPATGPEWTSLGHHVSAADAMYVHGQVWDPLSDKLINQLARSVGVSYLQRFEAVRLLLEHRVAHPWLLQAVGDFLDDPAVQIINDPMGVLEISPAPVAAEVILERLFTTQSADVFGAAADAAAIKIQDDFYGPQEIRKIEEVVLAKLSEPNATASGLEELINALPGGVAGATARRARVESPDTRSWSRSPPTANASAPTRPVASRNGSPTRSASSCRPATCTTTTR